MKGQIVRIISNLYTVNCDGVIYDCHSRGRFRKDNITPMVGDFVTIDAENKYILEIDERKNCLERPFVSNIDQALIVTSCKIPDFSTNLLDKLIVMCEVNDIIPIICVTKMDLVSDEELNTIKKILSYYEKIGYDVYYNNELDKIKKIFKDKTTVLTGQTGAGKSSLINKLNPDINLEVGEVSIALGRGRHTTRHVELLEIFSGKLVDTPGFSNLLFYNISKEDIRDSFIEFKNYTCRYKDCMHLNEQECSVKIGVENKEILLSRYQNYQKIIQEVENERKNKW